MVGRLFLPPSPSSARLIRSTGLTGFHSYTEVNDLMSRQMCELFSGQIIRKRKYSPAPTKSNLDFFLFVFFLPRSPFKSVISLTHLKYSLSNIYHG